MNRGKIFALVEGQDDKTFYRYYFNERVEIVPVGSCLYIAKLLEILNSIDKFHNIIFGIQDSDFYNVTQHERPCCENLFFTDFHDLEMMALHNEEVQRKICAEGNISMTMNLVESVMEDIRALSYLRLYNEVKIEDDGESDLKLNFKGYSMSAIYTGVAPIKLEDCIEHIKTKNSTSKIFPTSMEVSIFSTTYSKVSLWQLSRGHDVVRGICTKIAAIKGKHNEFCREKYIGMLIRSSFSWQAFTSTILFSSINVWANSLGLNLWHIS